MCVFAVSLFSCKITTSEPDKFTVAFDANGGNGTIESITKTENEEFELPANTFTRTGYTFSGWSTKATPDESSKFYKDKEKITLTEDLTLYAQWAAGTGTAYKVEHWQQNIADDDYTLAKTEPMTGTTGEETAAKAEETVGFTAKEFAQAKIAADGSTVIKIHYDRKTITLTFDADNGVDKTTHSGKFGAEIVSPVPEKTDFIFTGWSTDKIPNESSKSYKDKEKIKLTEDLTLYAQWKEISYKINYELNGGTNAEENPATFKKSDNVTLKEPTYEYFDFCGWYLTQDFAGESITGWNVGEKTSDITLYAKWTVKAENVVKAIENLTEGTHNICVVGEIDETTVKNIGEALRSNENAKVNLDLSETTGLERIPYQAFSKCSNLTNIEFPLSVTSINDYAFRGCSSLVDIKIPTSVTRIGNWAFESCTSLTNIEIPESVTSIGTCAFENCKNLTNIEIPTSITSIDDYTFYGCKSLTNLKLPASVIYINRAAFSFCTSLTNIEIPSSIKDLHFSVFAYCTSLTNVKILEGLTYIPDYVFYECTSLTDIEIPETVTKIDKSVFYGCSNLTTVNYMGTIEQWKKIDINEKENDSLLSAKIICTDGIINE